MCSMLPTLGGKQGEQPSLHGYQIGNLIALGGTSSVFSAHKQGHPFQGKWQVALKFVNHLAIARSEASSLLALSRVDGVVTLLDYFELPLAECRNCFTSFGEQDLQLLGFDNPEDVQKNEPGHVIGVLVLQYLAGQPLVCDTSPALPDEDTDASSFLVKDIETNAWYRQTLLQPFSLDQRLAILEQLAEHLADCHDRDVIHGDLNPQNILFDEHSEKVTVLDFGSATGHTRGSIGWQTPEHFALALGEIQALPKETDVFLLGMYLNRLLEPFSVSALHRLTRSCLSKPHKRPSARTVQMKLKQIIQKRKHTFKNTTAPLIWAASAFLPFLLWFQVLAPQKATLKAPPRPIIVTKTEPFYRPMPYELPDPTKNSKEVSENTLMTPGIGSENDWRTSAIVPSPAVRFTLEPLQGFPRNIGLSQQPENTAMRDHYFGPFQEDQSQTALFDLLISVEQSSHACNEPTAIQPRIPERSEALFARHKMWFENGSIEPVQFSNAPRKLGKIPITPLKKDKKKRWLRWLKRPFRRGGTEQQMIDTVIDNPPPAA